MAEISYTHTVPAAGRPQLGLGEEIYRSREGDALHKWINDVVPGAGESVLMGASALEYEIADGYAVFITQFRVALNTVSDNVQGNLMARHTDNGWQEISPHIQVFSAGTMSGSEYRMDTYNPPICLAYSDGWRQVGIQADANDAAAVCSFSWDGWVEQDD